MASILSHQYAIEWFHFCNSSYVLEPQKLRPLKKKKSCIYGIALKLQTMGFDSKIWSLLICKSIVDFIEDTEGDTMELRFLRDFEKREIDFVVIKTKNLYLQSNAKPAKSSFQARFIILNHV